MGKHKKKKPEIRFKGFTDDWEQRKLPEFVSFFNGLTYSPDDVKEIGTLVLRSSNVKNGEIIDADNVYVSDKAATSENVQEGDIVVVVRNGSRALIGKHAQIKSSMPNTVIGAFMSGIRSEHSSFVNALLGTSTFENEIEKNMGATINQITSYMFLKMEFMIPKGGEQERIGAYFSHLDHLITLHQCKLEKLKKVKKSMLEKMFPQNGEMEPQIRFCGFNSTWEQCKCGNLMNESREIGHKGNTAKKITVKLWGKGVYEKNESGSENTQYFIRHQGQFIYSKLDFLNSAFGVIPEPLEGYETTADVPAFDCDGINPYFMFYKAIQKNFYSKNGMIADGSRKAKRIHANTFLEMPIMIPSINEQNEIVKYLKMLDHLITLHQRKLEKLKKMKKAMLEKMFV